MQSKIILTKSLETLNQQIQLTIQDEFQPTLAIIFASDAIDLNELRLLFNQRNIQIIGASTSGEIGNTTIQRAGISILLLDMPASYFQIYQQEANYDTSQKVGAQIALTAKTYFKNPAFLLVFSMNICGETLIKGISDTLKGYPSIFGGMAGDDMRMKASSTFSNLQVNQNSATVLIIDNDKIAIEGMALSGWQPIGLENTITKATNNIIYEINEEPALNVVKRYFGDYFANSLDEDSLPLGIAQYPLQIIRKDAYVLRAALDANEADGSLLMAGPVTTGDTFRFSIAPGFEVIEETIQGFKDFAKEKPEADALLMFSCVARHMSLGPMIEEEIEGIYNVWKKPMAGFFTYGEVGQQRTGSAHFYNETCSLVLLKER